MNKIPIFLADQLKINRDRWSCELNNDPAFEVVENFPDTAMAMQLAIDKHQNVVLVDVNYMGSAHFGSIPAAPLSSLKEMIRMAEKSYQVNEGTRNERFLVIIEVTEGEVAMTLKLKILFLNKHMTKSMIIVKKMLFPAE